MRGKSSTGSPGEISPGRNSGWSGVRYLDKLVDELAKGKPMEKILREPA